MRTPARVVVWAAVLIGCAGAGAFVASRSDPFPPGVEDPGARPGERPTATSPTLGPSSVRWTLTARSRTSHELHVGGSCRSDWVIEASLIEAPDGRVEGAGEATMPRPAVCDTPNAQIQAERITLVFSGVSRGNAIELVMRETGRDPAGGHDLGGFANTLGDIRLRFRGLGSKATDVVEVDISDGNLGRYTSTTEAAVVCVQGC